MATSHIERGSLKNFKSASPGDVIKCFYLRRFLGQFEGVNPFPLAGRVVRLIVYIKQAMKVI